MRTSSNQVVETEAKGSVISCIQPPPVTSVEETWRNATHVVAAAAQSELGATEPGRRKTDKQPWLWTYEVMSRVRKKKRMYHAFFDSKTDDRWRKYCEAKRAAKKAVAVAKAAHYADVERKLDTKEGGRLIYRLAKSSKRQTEDIKKFHSVNDEHGYLPDNVTVDLWKSQCWRSADWLATLFNQIVAEKSVFSDWLRSTTIPIWECKGSPADCANYRPFPCCPIP